VTQKLVGEGEVGLVILIVGEKNVSACVILIQYFRDDVPARFVKKYPRITLINSVKRANYEAYHYVIFSIFLLLPLSNALGTGL
jgi:hypothetical protein